MGMREMEFLGNDRYFKYRYTKETPVNITTIYEYWAYPINVVRYQFFEEYFKRSVNMKVFYELNRVWFYDMYKIYTHPQYFQKSHVIAFDTPRSLFENRLEYYTPSPPYGTTKLTIVSGPPKRVMSTTFSFLNMDNDVAILTVLTLVLVSILLVIHSIVTNKYKSLTDKKFVKKLAKETLENVWENASLLCSEPIPVVLPHITCRLLASSWLIGATFILFFLGCFLRTEFTTESYNCIDTLSDLIKSGITPIMIEDSGTFESLQVLAGQDPAVQRWLDTLDKENIFTSLADYMQFHNYIPILSGEKALIVSDSDLTWLMGQLLTLDSATDGKDFFMSKEGLYFSQYDLRFDYLHLIFNTTWLRSSPQVHENLQLIMTPLFEMETFKFQNFKFHHAIEQVTWKRPLKNTIALDLSSVTVPFYFLLMLLSGTVAAVITEIIFN